MDVRGRRRRNARHLYDGDGAELLAAAVRRPVVLEADTRERSAEGHRPDRAARAARGAHGDERGSALTRYTARSAVATGSRAARTAGSSPPMSPTEHASATPIASNAGVTRIWNTIDPVLSPSATELPLNISHA